MRGSRLLRELWARWRRADAGVTKPADPWPEFAQPRHPDADRFSAVLAEAYRRGYRKPAAQVRELLDQAFHAAGLSYSQGSMDEFVRSLAAERPWLVGALLARFHRRKHEAEFRARRATAQPPQDPEPDALGGRLFDLPGVVRVGWLPFNRDQVVYVGLDPWSDGTAEQVRQAAAPGRSGSSADATPSLPRA